MIFSVSSSRLPCHIMNQYYNYIRNFVTIMILANAYMLRFSPYQHAYARVFNRPTTYPTT